MSMANLRYNDDMGKSTTRAYRRQYSAELRASMAKCSNSYRSRGRKFGLTVSVCLGVAIIVGAVGLMCWNNIEPEAIAKSSSTTDGSVTSQPKPVELGVTKSRTIIPYSTTIGFIGDSLTFGCCNDSTPAPTIEVASLGDNYRAINRGVNGSTTSDWRNKLLDSAIDEFVANDVEIVQIMLGTNDIAQGIPINEIIDNLRNIIDQLRDNGVKIFIINKIPYSLHRDDLTVRQYNVALDELPNGSDIFMGDDQSYQYFREHQDQLYDGLHMNQDGYIKLAELWSDAFRRIVVEPSQTATSLSNNAFHLDSDDVIKYQIDKPSRWFVAGLNGQSGVLIDDQFISPEGYSVISAGDKTLIELRSDYLNKLSVGEHSLAVWFADGVSFTESFAVVKE